MVRGLSFFYACIFVCLTGLLNGQAYSTDLPNSASQTNIIRFEKPLNTENLGGKISYFLDISGDIEIDQISRPDFRTSFQTAGSAFLNFGFVTHPIWLKVSLENATRNKDRLLVNLNQSFFRQFSAYQTMPDGRMANIMTLDESSTFDARPIANPFLVVPVDLKPGETADVYIRYASQDSTTVAPSIETSQSLMQLTNANLFKNSVFNGMMLLLSAIPAAIFIYTRKLIFFSYSASTFFCLMTFVVVDGNGFQHLWPSAPDFNAMATLTLSAISLFFLAAFAREVLQTARFHKVLDLIFLANMAAIALLLFMFVVTGDPDLSLLLFVLFPITYLCCLVTGLIAARKHFRRVRFYVASWLMILILSIRFIINEIFFIDVSLQTELDILRVIFVADAIFMGLGLLDHYNHIKAATSKDLRAKLEQAQQNLLLAKQLDEHEERFAALSRKLEGHDAQVMKSISDIDQQLPELRDRLEKAMSQRTEREKELENIQKAFGNLETSIREGLAENSVNAKIV